MNMREIFREHPVLCIMRNIPLDKTIDYVQAILNGGVCCFEVAMNSTDACRQISMLREHFGEQIHLGAGTAITIERAENAIKAGVEFLLTPSVDEEILKYCKEHAIPLLPGVLTPSDVGLCLKYGFDVMKLFPAEDVPKTYVKSLKGPFDDTDYVAIGGVTLDTVRDFMQQGYLGVGIGGGIMPKEYVETNNWEAAAAYVKELVNRCRI